METSTRTFDRRGRPQSLWQAACLLLTFVLVPVYTVGLVVALVETTQTRMITPACRYYGERREAKRPCRPHPEIVFLQPRILSGRGPLATLPQGTIAVVVLSMLFASMPLAMLTANAVFSAIAPARREFDQLARDYPDKVQTYAAAQRAIAKVGLPLTAAGIVIAFAAAVLTKA